MEKIFNKIKSIWGLLIVSCFFYSNSLAQVDKVHIEYERVSDRMLIVWGGKIYKDQVIAIATEKGIVMIDAGKAPTLTKEYRKIIEHEFGRNDFTYVINTHYHFDHTSGNQIFPEAEIIAHQKTPAKMKQWADNRQKFIKTRRANQMIRWKKQLAMTETGSEQYERLNDYLTTGRVMLDDYENNYVLTLPNITFNDKVILDLGNITLNLFYFGEGLHTGDDILIFCPEEKVLFSGDLFYKGYFGFAFKPKFDGDRWLSVLNELFSGANKIEWVYDCHNGKMTGDYISLYYRYMKDVWESLKKAKEQKLDFEAIMEEFSYEKRFSYIDKSGLNNNVLEKGHNDNLKFTWYCINNIVKPNEQSNK
ncbi:hypothetical protein B6I21_06130 [candidate division KSB1 bacterium 4572_119]|nr:MAG: hypothetical protein B6I21_06130 [candidate division KSB1 bacterium 4572_119]